MEKLIKWKVKKWKHQRDLGPNQEGGKMLIGSEKHDIINLHGKDT